VASFIYLAEPQLWGHGLPGSIDCDDCCEDESGCHWHSRLFDEPFAAWPYWPSFLYFVVVESSQVWYTPPSAQGTVALGARSSPLRSVAVLPCRRVASCRRAIQVRLWAAAYRSGQPAVVATSLARPWQLLRPHLGCSPRHCRFGLASGVSLVVEGETPPTQTAPSPTEGATAYGCSDELCRRASTCGRSCPAEAFLSNGVARTRAAAPRAQLVSSHSSTSIGNWRIQWGSR